MFFTRISTAQSNQSQHTRSAREASGADKIDAAIKVERIQNTWRERGYKRGAGGGGESDGNSESSRRAAERASERLFPRQLVPWSLVGAWLCCTSGLFSLLKE